MMQGSPRAINAVAILIAPSTPEAVVPFYRFHFARDGVMRRNTTMRKREREMVGEGLMMHVSLLTECVEILDGHTTNKRDPSDDI